MAEKIKTTFSVPGVKVTDEELENVLIDLQWVQSMLDIIKEINEYLSKNPNMYIGRGSKLHYRMKDCLKDD